MAAEIVSVALADVEKHTINRLLPLIFEATSAGITAAHCSESLF
ncbi:hypothetical protein V3595_23950 [Bacillus sp. CFBP9009]